MEDSGPKQARSDSAMVAGLYWPCRLLFIHIPLADEEDMCSRNGPCWCHLRVRCVFGVLQ